MSGNPISASPQMVGGPTTRERVSYGIAGPVTHNNMAGMGSTLKVTPQGSGDFLIWIGNFPTSVVAGGPSLRYGTGTPPAAGAAATGIDVGLTVGGTAGQALAVHHLDTGIPLFYCLQGLKVGVTYWFDLDLGTNAGSSVSDVVFQAIEL